jgi:protein TonB
MRTFFLRTKAGCFRYRGQLLSAMAHLTLLLFVVGGVGRSPQVRPYRLPGTVLGDTVLTYYSPGSSHPVTSPSPFKNPKKTKAAPVVRPVPSTAEIDRSEAVEAKAGVGTATESGVGEGDISIALLNYSPFPAPDLSSLPHGTGGDVILDAVIDEHGNISELTLLKGLGSPVDDSVIATARQWRYVPAMRNGVPVVSEQELHFHYERG